MSKPTDTVPCKWCATPTRMLGTRMCNRCWELEHRTLAPAQAAFRASPSRSTALAYMDAAIREFEQIQFMPGGDSGYLLCTQMQEIRDGLMNERMP